MAIEIYVGNLNYRTNEDGLRDLFGEHGQVERVSVITDRETGRSRGFGFVTMADESEGSAAIAAINGKEFEGRTLTVNQARGRRERGGGGY